MPEERAEPTRARARYALAVAIAALTLSATAALVPVLGAPFHLLAFPAVMVAALRGGIAAGLLCAAAYGAGALLLLVDPRTLRLSDPRALARLASAAASMALVAALAGRLRTALSRERRCRREAEGEVLARAQVEERLRRAHVRLAGLQDLTGALSAARTPGEVAEAALRVGLTILGARAGSVSLLRGRGSLVLMRHAGLSDAAAQALAEVPLGASHPLADAAHGGDPLWIPDEAAFDARWPHLAAGRAREEDRAFAILPLVAHGLPVGVLSFTFAAPRPFELLERTYAEAVALHCAEALGRARLFESERAARARAEDAEVQARRGARLQDQILGVVGHDLRTPLSAVTMGIALLRRSGGPPSPATLDRIARSAARIDDMIRDLLDLARARQGLGMTLSRTALDLDEICAQVVGELADARPGRAVRLRVAGDARILGDRSRVLQAVSNLVANALQHGDDAGEVEVEVASEGEHVLVRVHNGGAPISPDSLARIFEPFHRGAGARDGRGSIGLGLFIVREIARAHGGDVTVTSDRERGTTFVLGLPRGPGLERVERPRATPPPERHGAPAPP